MRPHTHPKPSPEDRERSNLLLERFSAITGYRPGDRNPGLRYLHSIESLTPEQVVAFLNFFYLVSVGQPGLLFLMMSALKDHKDRGRVFPNVAEEDGWANPGDDPHFVLLERLIKKLGGRVEPPKTARDIVEPFYDGLPRPTAAEAVGIIAGVEHPGMDISKFLRRMVSLAGFASLLPRDPYLYIHADVEDLHVLWSHSHAEEYMDRGPEEREGVLRGFRRAMSFWDGFWPPAFATLGAPLDLFVT